MNLHEHPDFEQAILRAAEHFRGRGLRPATIEKDYYVTEALRIISVTAGDKVIFKGGTSLSKGWNLIQRFSEDADIFLDPLAFEPPLGKNGIDRELKKLRDAVGAHPMLTFVENESQTIGGFGRNDRFSYVQRFGGPGEVTNRVLAGVYCELREQACRQIFVRELEALRRITHVGYYEAMAARPRVLTKACWARDCCEST
ncbi:MAG TPA: nucleotidyl transferase AbiEii/AbiGii toxin family protein [Terracidiphilus sp.]